MNQNAPDLALVDRFTWLVLVPTGLALTPWLLVFLGPGGDESARLTIAALAPVPGLLVPPAYRWVTREPVRLVPYLPLALATLVFTASTIDLAIGVAREPDGAFIPVLPFGLGFLLPFIAFGCGLAGFVVRGRWDQA